MRKTTNNNEKKTKLKNLKPGERAYKVSDRDGLYVSVSTAGGISFRFNYRVNGRQETLTLGRYGVGGRPFRRPVTRSQKHGKGWPAAYHQ